VDFVDEQDRLGILAQLRDDALEALLEIAAVLGAGHQRAQIQRPNRGVLEDLGHPALDDASRQTLGQRGLADASLADIQRIVLAPPAQHVDGALDLVSASDQRIDLALPRQLVEVDRVIAQRIGFAIRALFLLALARTAVAGGIRFQLGDAVRDVVDHVQPAHFLLVEEIHRV